MTSSAVISLLSSALFAPIPSIDLNPDIRAGGCRFLGLADGLYSGFHTDGRLRLADLVGLAVADLVGSLPEAEGSDVDELGLAEDPLALGGAGLRAIFTVCSC
jgi:hypothetical protein